MSNLLWCILDADVSKMLCHWSLSKNYIFLFLLPVGTRNFILYQYKKLSLVSCRASRGLLERGRKSTDGRNPRCAPGIVLCPFRSSWKHNILLGLINVQMPLIEWKGKRKWKETRAELAAKAAENMNESVFSVGVRWQSWATSGAVRVEVSNTATAGRRGASTAYQRNCFLVTVFLCRISSLGRWRCVA